MSDDPNSPKLEEGKKVVRFIIHVLYIILALMIFFAAAALLDVIAGPTPLDLGIVALIFFGIFISIFLVTVEVIYFCRLNRPCKTPDSVKRYLGFLTRAVGRGVLYQVLGFPFMRGVNYRRYWYSNIGAESIIYGQVIWFIGFCLMIIAILARAYGFADWIEDEEDEGELRLESDDEDSGLLRDQGGLSKL